MSAPLLVRALALSAVILVLVGIAARRLLGLEVGWVRVLFAAAVGYTIAALISQTFDRGGSAVLLSVLVGISVLITMAALVVAETLAPSGSRPVRNLRRRLARTRRYAQITGIGARYGLRPYLSGRRNTQGADAHRHERLGRSLRMALEEAGVTFVKVGQLLSARRDVLPGR